ncbi:glycosyltransferase [Wocania ichthyoenteri]|uniref:glycosyltransferase n=1 Tax=Wocania ichthyoenteri TaxID=1230531 RepID=UPI00053EB5AF|nr:nucleotide disphospho-sugar-binding domain-containing protein [Wocania ichthyoenteri]
MQHIAIITSGMVGITNASLKLVSKLKAEGYKVTYLCPIDIKEKIEKHEVNYIQLPEINYDFSFLKPNGFLYHFTHLKNQYYKGKKELNFYKYEKILNNLKPDFILIDEELHELIFTSIKLNIPIKLISQFFCSRMRFNLPPICTSIIPKKGLKGSTAGILYAWLFLKLKIFGRALLNKTTLKNSRRSVLKKYAQHIGLSRKSLISRNFPSVFIHRDIPILSMSLPELEFSHSKPKNLSYIGPMVSDSNFKGLDIPDALKTIIESKTHFNKKLIYCSITTMAESGDTSFVRKVIDAVKNEENWELIISLGGKLSADTFKNSPNNVHVFKWVPQLYLLSKIDCSINHGGIHTINECISNKVPMLIYSGKKFDQNGNAARIAYHGLGLMGDKDLESSVDIHSKIKTIINNTSFYEKMKATHEIYKSYDAKKISSYL